MLEKDNKNSTPELAKGFTRSLHYRPIVRWAYRGTILFSLSCFIGAFFLLTSFITQNDFLLLYCAIISLAIATVVSSLAALVLLPMSQTSVHISPEKMILERGKQRVTVSFSDVETLKVKVNPIFGSRIFITTKDDKKYSFSTLLERSDYIVRNIALVRPELFSEDGIAIYRIETVSADHSWARIHQRLMPFEKVLLYHFAIAFLMVAMQFAIFYAANRVISDLIYWINCYSVWLGSSMTISLLLNIAGEAYYRQKVVSGFKTKAIEIRRNMEKEKQFHRKLTFSQIVTCLVFVSTASIFIF